MTQKDNDLVFVLSGEVGEIGGAAKSTRLLCEALMSIGKKVRLFVTLPPDPSTYKKLQSQGIEVMIPVLNVGWRWELPAKLNAIRVFCEAIKSRPALIHCHGLSTEANYLLQLPRTAPIYVWESTE